MEEKNAFLSGHKIYLRPLNKEDADGNYPNWFNDPKVCEYNGHYRVPNTKEKTLKYIESLANSSDTIVFAIVENETNKHVGNVSLSKINWIDRDADISIIIGEKDAWGKGYAKETWRLLIDYGFNVLNLHRIYCGTHKENIGMQKVAQSLGMIEEGVFKEAIFKKGQYFDIIRYAIINKNN